MRIRVIDLETTGLALPETVCQVGWCDVVGEPDLAGGWTNWVVGAPSQTFVDPGKPIPPEASAIHHIVDSDVVGAMPLADHFVGDDDPVVDAYAAHSIKFERQWLTDELVGLKPWICTYKCALRLWPDAPSHSNQALRYWRRPVGLSRLAASYAHSAGPDAYVSAFLLRDLLSMAPVDQLIEWSTQPALQARCHIGKNRGLLWTEVDDGFLYWLLDKDFDEDVLFTAQHEIKRRRAAQSA